MDGNEWRQPIMPFAPVALLTSVPALVTALGGEGPHKGIAVRLLGSNVVDVEVETDLPYSIVVPAVPEAGSEQDTGDSRWQWPATA